MDEKFICSHCKEIITKQRVCHKISDKPEYANFCCTGCYHAWLRKRNLNLKRAQKSKNKAKE